MAHITRIFESFAEKADTTERMQLIAPHEIRDRVEAICPGYKAGSLLYPSIYRGAKRDREAYLCTPSATLRRSKNASNNVYNILVSANAGYPDRLRSLICSSAKEYAAGYGTVYLVIPALGAQVAVCAKEDIWESFPQLCDRLGCYNLGGFADLMEFVFQEVGVVSEGIVDMPSLVAALERVQKVGLASISDNPYYGSQVAALAQFVQEGGGTLLSTLRDAFDPGINKFYSFEYGRKVSKMRLYNEVWTSSPCVMVELEAYKEAYGVKAR